ncbi:hypothetical protein GCM10010446_44390 [Streptomyces enissocaesilis]|uniref:Uncharacterized protein n=1 Tax=Streptomyces enissocaesilis TaxID=332589 RepID=A0ABP6K136_9ACTN
MQALRGDRRFRVAWVDPPSRAAGVYGCTDMYACGADRRRSGALARRRYQAVGHQAGQYRLAQGV